MPLRMRVGIALLRIDDRDRRYVYDHFDRGGTLQHVDRTTHSHENRADEFAATDLRHQFSCNVGRSKVRGNEYVSAALQGAKGILLFDTVSTGQEAERWGMVGMALPPRGGGLGR